MTHPHLLEPLEPRLQLDAVPAADLAHTTAQLSAAHSGPGAATVDSCAIFAGGINVYGATSDVIDIYDTASGHWSTATLPPRNLGSRVYTIRSKAIVMDDVEAIAAYVYDAVSRQWSTLPIPHPHFLGAGAVVGDELVLAGGYTSSFQFSDVVDIYNVAKGRWYSAKLSQARGQIAAATVGNLVVFAGGSIGQRFQNPATGQSDAVDIYNASTGQWSTARLPHGRYMIVAANANDSAIFAEGLIVPHNGTVFRGIDVYDASLGCWSATSIGREDVTAATAAGAKAFLLRSDGRLSIYDSISQRWSLSSAAPPAQGAWDTGIALGTKLLLVGGGDSGGIIDVYDTGTGKWSTSTLAEARFLMGITTIGTQAFFAGGLGGHGSGDLVDIFTDLSPAPSLGGSITRGGRNSVAVALHNSGDAALSAPYTVNVYATAAGVLDRHAILLGTVEMDAPLAAGDSRRFTVPLSLHGHLPGGDYRLVAAVNTRRAVPFAGATITTAHVKPATKPQAQTARAQRASPSAIWSDMAISLEG